ncbi:unnamed protein product [Caenorhabditis angaria]|uniref:Peptidase C1A papain C-terminal domain-containing protein n=1 Tax=Caenorhabditis angaria TaxID=860376 RepID=A0A9P1N8V6_9PELO|nr:unnamed protein product [Caenorhabditis angaria]
MYFFFLWFLVGFARLEIDIPDSLDDLNPIKISQLFEKFIKEYKKSYETPLEKTQALATFGENLATIINLNIESVKSNLQFGVNQYADLTDEEFSDKILTLEPKIGSDNLFRESIYNSTNFVVHPDSWDWRSKKVVAPVKYQGGCGCCWAFTTVAVVQSVIAIKTGKIPEPSEQELCDCGQGKGRAGCNGGNLGKSFDYVKNNGITEETNYPKYNDKRATTDQVCEESGKPNNIKISNYQFISQATVPLLEDALINKGPLGVGFRVGKSFRYYKSGIFASTDCDVKSTFYGWHAVTVVGYGVENKIPFWIVKNSWSEKWGEQGYFRIIKGRNLCGFEQTMPFFAEP